MTWLPLEPPVGSPRSGAGAAGRFNRLVRLIPGELDYASIEQLALRTGLCTDHAAAARLVSEAADKGLLIRRDEFLRRLRSRPGAGTAAGRVSRVGILSHGGSDAVRITASGLLNDPSIAGGRTPLVICDDSGSAPGEALCELGRRAAGNRLRFLGAAERGEFLDLLLGMPELAGAHRDALRFGLGGDSRWRCRAGANRNWWLLETAGETSVLIDDDEGPAALGTSRGHGLSLSASFHPLHMREFERGHVAGTEAFGSTASFMEAFGEVTGRSAADLVRRFDDASVDLSTCGGTLVSGLLNSAALPVAVAAGVAGHPGWGSRRSLWHLGGEDREELVANRAAFRRTLVSPAVYWAADTLTVSQSPFFRAGCAAYCGAAGPPPFSPVGRNEDGLFGLLVHQCHPPGSFVHVPVAVAHRDRSRIEGNPFEFVLKTNEYLSLMLHDAKSSVGETAEPTQALATIGAYLGQCAAVPPAHFADYLADLARGQGEAEYRTLTTRLETHRGQPRWWAREVRQRLGAIDGYLRVPVPDVADVEIGDRDARLAALQEATGGFGRFLALWPVLYRAATALREGGRSVSRPLSAGGQP